MDYKSVLMKVLHCFGENEGVWFEPQWQQFGISKEEAEKVKSDYKEFYANLEKETQFYCYETPSRHVQFRATSDEAALAAWKDNWIVLYRESDSPNGLPFVILRSRY